VDPLQQLRQRRGQLLRLKSVLTSYRTQNSRVRITLRHASICSTPTVCAQIKNTAQGGARRGEGRGGSGDDEVGDRKRLSWPEHVSIDRMRPPCHTAHHGRHPRAVATRSEKGSRSARSKKSNQPWRSFSFSSRSRLFFILWLVSLGSAGHVSRERRHALRLGTCDVATIRSGLQMRGAAAGLQQFFFLLPCHALARDRLLCMIKGNVIIG
jgi:hypothetical protein